MDAHFWQTAAIAVGGVAETMFVILYGIAPWWRDFVGRAMFAKSLTLMVLIDLAIVDALIVPLSALVFAILYWAVAVGIVWQLGALIRQRRHARR